MQFSIRDGLFYQSLPFQLPLALFSFPFSIRRLAVGRSKHNNTFPHLPTPPPSPTLRGPLLPHNYFPLIPPLLLHHRLRRLAHPLDPPLHPPSLPPLSHRPTHPCPRPHILRISHTFLNLPEQFLC